MESWYTKLFSMTLVKVKMHLEGLNGWNEIVKPKKLKVIVWQRKLESHLTFFSKPNKTCNYQYCKWWLYIISNQPQQPAVQINLILATHFGDGTDLRRSPHQQCCFSNGTEMYLLVEVWVGLVQSDQRISHLCPFLIVGLLVLVCKAASWKHLLVPRNWGWRRARGWPGCWGTSPSPGSAGRSLSLAGQLET